MPGHYDDQRVDSLGIIVDLSTMVSFGSKCFLSSILKRISAAFCPISAAGWVTVDKGGSNSCAVLRFEKLMIFISPGILMFNCLHAL